jgi:Zn-finger nucleic acid-binding protein
MRTVDRNGIHIEQCSQCRGVFLDAGELEQIAAAEERFYGGVPAYEPPAGQAPAPAAQAPPPRAAPEPQPRYYGDSPKPYRGGYKDSPPGYGHHRRKRSFLESLFD